VPLPLYSENFTCATLRCAAISAIAELLFHVLNYCSGLTNIDLLRNYLHLRYVDLSKNELDDVSALGWLDSLLTVRVDFNLLSGSIVILERRYLQVASFANNRLTSCDGAAHPMLDHLCLNSEFQRYFNHFQCSGNYSFAV